jgi:hypothetical protein
MWRAATAAAYQMPSTKDKIDPFAVAGIHPGASTQITSRRAGTHAARGRIRRPLCRFSALAIASPPSRDALSSRCSRDWKIAHTEFGVFSTESETGSSQIPIRARTRQRNMGTPRSRIPKASAQIYAADISAHQSKRSVELPFGLLARRSVFESFELCKPWFLLVAGVGNCDLRVMRHMPGGGDLLNQSLTVLAIREPPAIHGTITAHPIWPRHDPGTQRKRLGCAGESTSGAVLRAS